MPKLVVISLIIGLLVAGCGSSANSGSSGDTTDDGTISKVAFAKKANQICAATIKTVLAKTTPVVEGESKNPGYDREAVEAKLIHDVMAPELRNELEQLQGLGSPPNDEDKVNAILDAIQKITERAETEAEALVSYNNNAMAKATGLAHRYGLTECPYG